MGRTNGRLIPFLRNALDEGSFANLKWKDRNFQTFSLNLPRYEKRKDLRSSEDILKKWCHANGRVYHGYSNAKAVIQASLRKSVYLVPLKSTDSDLNFKFATKEETKERRRLQKEKSNAIIPEADSFQTSENSGLSFPYESNLLFSSTPSPNRPSSVSSGYQSGNDDFEENMHVSEDSSALGNPDILADLLKDPDKFLENNLFNNVTGDYNETFSMDAFSDIEDPPVSMIENREEAVSQAAIIENNSGAVIASEDIVFNELTAKIQDITNPVTDITATMVNSAESPKTYWLCGRKLYVDSMLLLICDKQTIGENQGIIPDQVVIPNNVFEPGVFYNLATRLELAGKYFLFLLPNN